MSTNRDEAGGPAGRSTVVLDDLNRMILAELRSNGRISMSALAEKVRLSRASVYSRVSSLVEAGVITGFSAMVDPRRSGLSICALVFVTVQPQTWQSFRGRISGMSQVEYCAVTTGQHDAMLLIRAAEVADVHDFVIGVISALPEVRAVETVLVLDEVVRRPYLLPQERATAEHGATVGMTRFIPAAPSHAGLEFSE